MHWLYAHMIGDFILQSDWMAKGKKVNSWICAVHIFFYMTPFVFTGLPWVALAIIAVQHFIQDRTNFVSWSMILLGKPTFSQPPFAPWSIILMDQLYHILFVAFVVYLFV